MAANCICGIERDPNCPCQRVERRFPCVEATVDLRFPGFMLRFWLNRNESLHEAVDRLDGQRTFAAGVAELLKDKGLLESRSLTTDEAKELLGFFADFAEVNAVQLVRQIDSLDLGDGVTVIASQGAMIYTVEF